MSYNPTITDYKETETNKICTQYHDELIPEFVNSIAQNISERVKQTVNIINKNQYISRDIRYRFNFNSNAFVTQTMAIILPIIKENTLVDVPSCKTIPKSKSDYRKVARNRLNRNKPKFIGNYVFGPLIFDELYQFCRKIFNNDGIIVFVSILSDILSPKSVIRFDQTRAQPLIPYNTFVIPNDFRTSCIDVLRHYRLDKLETEWHAQNKKTAKDKWYYFITECLPEISERCCNNLFKTPICLFHPQTTPVPVHSVVDNDKQQHIYAEQKHQYPPNAEYNVSTTNTNNQSTYPYVTHTNTYMPPSTVAAPGPPHTAPCVVPMHNTTQRYQQQQHIYTNAPCVDQTMTQYGGCCMEPMCPYNVDSNRYRPTPSSHNAIYTPHNNFRPQGPQTFIHSYPQSVHQQTNQDQFTMPYSYMNRNNNNNYNANCSECRGMNTMYSDWNTDNKVNVNQKQGDDIVMHGMNESMNINKYKPFPYR